MKKFLFIICFFFVIGIGCFIYDGYQLYQQVIDEVALQERVSQIQNQENYMTLDLISSYSVKATIAVEDHRFYEHHGFDFIATGSAFIYNMQTLSLERGGSTITQQLAKNMYFSQEKQLVRKIAELLVAFDLEKQYSKETILELYFNTIYYGNGYYSIYDASIGYFNKAPRELSLDEASWLAGIPNAPSIYSDDAYSELALQRQRQVLECMVKYEYITEEEMNVILET